MSGARHCREESAPSQAVVVVQSHDGCFWPSSSLPFLPVSVCPGRSTSPLHLSFGPLFVLPFSLLSPLSPSPALLLFPSYIPSLAPFPDSVFSQSVSLCTLPDYTYLVSRVRRILHHLCPFGVVFTGLHGCATCRPLIVAVHTVKKAGLVAEEKKGANGESRSSVSNFGYLADVIYASFEMIWSPRSVIRVPSQD